jgi:hypothetical protein
MCLPSGPDASKANIRGPIQGAERDAERIPHPLHARRSHAALALRSFSSWFRAADVRGAYGRHRNSKLHCASRDDECSGSEKIDKISYTFCFNRMKYHCHHNQRQTDTGSRRQSFYAL